MRRSAFSLWKSVESDTEPMDNQPEDEEDHNEQAMMGQATVQGTGAHTGICKTFNQEKGFGFVIIDGQPEGSMDGFVHLKQCVGSCPAAGDELQFDMVESKSNPGQMVLQNVTGGSLPLPGQSMGMGGMEGEPMDDRPLPELLHGRRFHGSIKSFSEKDRYGFIESDEVRACFQKAGQAVKDVFLHLKDKAGFQAGDPVTFLVSLNDKQQPQASELMSTTWVNDPFAMYRFHGVVKSWYEDRRYGFITSEGVQDVLRKTNCQQKDVFLLASEKQEFGVGDVVTFSVRLRSGGPQAFDLGPGQPAFYGHPVPPIDFYGYAPPTGMWPSPPLIAPPGYPQAARPTQDRSRSRSRARARPRPSMAPHLR